MASLKRTLLSALALGLAVTHGVVPASAQSASDVAAAENQSRSAVNRFVAKQPGISSQLKTAYGYAIYPEITKAGFLIGGAGGDGIVYRGGKVVAFSRASQFTVGAQVGGQTFSQLLIFQNKAAFDRFARGEFVFGASASAVAGKQGESEAADYKAGVATYTLVGNGLMAEAAIGGLKFTYKPLAAHR